MTRRAAELGVTGVAVVGLALAAGLPRTAGGKLAAELGVALALGSSVVALGVRRWRWARSLPATMGAIGAIFALRLVLVVAGLLWVRTHGGASAAYVVAFFAAYLVVQWIEIGDALSETRRDRGEK